MYFSLLSVDPYARSGRAVAPRVPSPITGGGLCI